MTTGIKSMEIDSGQLCWFELGEGKPLVLLHGWSMSHAVFLELAELLAEDFRLLIPDLPGHGNSASVEPCSLDAMAVALGHWLTALAVEPVALLGWSLGGQVAMTLALTRPALVERLVLISTTPRFCAAPDWSAGLPLGELRALRRGLQRRYLATMGEFFDLQFVGEEMSAARRREILGFAVRSSKLPEPTQALETLELLGREDLRPRVPEIRQPALILHGEADRIIPFAAGAYLAAHLPAAELCALEGVGHAPFLSNPKQVAAQLMRFCR